MNRDKAVRAAMSHYAFDAWLEAANGDFSSLVDKTMRVRRQGVVLIPVEERPIAEQ